VPQVSKRRYHSNAVGSFDNTEYQTMPSTVRGGLRPFPDLSRGSGSAGSERGKQGKPERLEVRVSAPNQRTSRVGSSEEKNK